MTTRLALTAASLAALTTGLAALIARVVSGT